MAIYKYGLISDTHGTLHMKIFDIFQVWKPSFMPVMWSVTRSLDSLQELLRFTQWLEIAMMKPSICLNTVVEMPSERLVLLMDTCSLPTRKPVPGNCWNF